MIVISIKMIAISKYWKGVFTKMKGGICWFYMRKLLKRLISKNIASIYKFRKLQHTTRIVKKKSILFHANHSDITTYNHRLFFDAFVNSWYFIIFVLYTMHLKRRFVPALGVSATCNHSDHREQRHLAANYFGVLSALYIKQIKNIVKSQLYTNASKNSRWL